jgi:PKD repeat protein
MLFGSYFGDWDSQDNFLRSAIASGQTLTDCWSGRPNWVFHHMALGETIGYDALLSMNNTVNFSTPVYDEPGYGANFVTMALVGDPTLKLFPMRPLTKIDLTDVNGNVAINWETYPDSVDHYELYSRTSANSPFKLIKNFPSNQSSYMDSCVTQNQYIEYMVRASALETTASGTYYNLSKGAHKSIIPNTLIAPQLTVNYVIQNENVTFTATGNASSYLWKFGDGTTSTEVSPEHSYTKSGTFTVLLYTNFNCSSKIDTFIVSVIITGVANPVNALSLKLFPTVANNDLTLELNNAIQANWKIINTNGQILRNGQLADKQVKINVAELVTGLYYLEVETDSETLVKNFSIQR